MTKYAKTKDGKIVKVDMEGDVFTSRYEIIGEPKNTIEELCNEFDATTLDRVNIKLLLYCTKGKPYLKRRNQSILDNGIDKYIQSQEIMLNGKIVAECDFEVSDIELHLAYSDYCRPVYFTKRKEPFKYFSYTDLLNTSCMEDNEIFRYLGHNGGKAIHIENLHIFDKAKELSEFYSIHDIGGMLLTDKLTKAPKNMQRISLNEWEYGTYNSKDIAVLLPIHPELLCKILNGKCTIIIKRKF